MSPGAGTASQPALEFRSQGRALWCYSSHTPAGKPHTGGKDQSVWNTPGFRAVHHLGVNLTQAGEGDVSGAEFVPLLQRWEFQAGAHSARRFIVLLCVVEALTGRGFLL